MEIRHSAIEDIHLIMELYQHARQFMKEHGNPNQWGPTNWPPEELIRSGEEQAFLKLKERYPNVCLVHLYALEGAVCNVEFNSLSESRKRELKEFNDFLKGSLREF